MATLKKNNTYFRLTNIIGLLLSFYALIVKLKKEGDETYEALCDINEYINCSKPLFSRFGKGFGIFGQIFGEKSIVNQPNSIAGIIFYSLLIVMSFSSQKSIIKLQIVFCVISNIMSVYLAYILYFILKDFCIICVAIYVVNALNLILSISKLGIVRRETMLNAKKKSG